MPPDDSLHSSRWRAHLALEFERRAGRSVLASRRHDGPLVVQKALHPEGDAVCHAIVVHPPAGIAGGDELLIDIAAGERSSALLTTPGAGKWYRSAGSWAKQHVRIDASTAATVEWLPQETIVYDGALADIRWEARIAADARLIAWDIVCLGRTGSGEGFDRGRCRIETRLTRDGKLAWLERGRIEPGSRVAASPAGLGGHSVFGTMFVATPMIEDEWIASCREEAPRSGEAAVTRLPGVLVARYRGDSSESARWYFAALWKRLREPVLGFEAVEPRIWRT
ncbi:MAG: urease accessory protein UreD [Usitatibacter sp.]